MYTVGRLARRFGLSRSTLLYYDKIGLLRPSSHAHGEYRHYSEADAERLQRICMFRDAGLSLADIARALDAPRDGGGKGKPGDGASLSAILEERLEELQREMVALRNQRTIITGLLGLDILPEATPINKELWTSLLSDAGFSEADMRRWHVDFERTAPEQHARFLKVLGIPPTEIGLIRAWAAAPQRLMQLQKMTDNYMKALYDAFTGLPRLAPGGDEYTLKALDMVPDLPECPRIIDIGCGQGAQTLAIAKARDCRITAVDNHQPFLDMLTDAARTQGVAERIDTVCSDMADLPEALRKGGYDLVWSEGAAYIMGFDAALEYWKQCLAPNGHMVLSEICWYKRGTPPQELADFWATGYPAMMHADDFTGVCEKAGYSVLGSFTLPPSSWWDELYGPLEKRFPLLKAQYADDEEGLACILSTIEEVELHRKYPDWYGYKFVVLRRNS
ncbi:MerR family transcriptional regulator [Desulfovibrio mangrovi]|uniref:MerR family transcriptional regulator n=1 Tax=Desulfovibrio mangrovi TaxID=2976983 RepID=UPI00224602F2|nr:MerR family transcriptional regulator [Desulfovibrio mangrovi]UZP65944.1 MerR family transcriptional regulator [Desulfovibrio mangrovi]